MRKVQSKRAAARRLKQARSTLRAAVAALRGMAEAAAPRGPRPVPVPVPADPRLTPHE